MGWLWWVGAALVFGILEMESLSLVFAMLAGGALAGAVAYALGADVWLQCVVAAVVALLMLFVLRPWLLRHLRKRVQLVETNTAALVGRDAVALSTVTPEGGRVKIGGEVWSARVVDEDAAPIPPGAPVRVARIEGATAVVAPSLEV
jgi:membrane protein implicated in regulation of membrane protease activity